MGNICLGLQGSLVEFPNLTMGAWNPLQLLKTMQALQTLTLLGVRNLDNKEGLKCSLESVQTKTQRVHCLRH